MQKMRKCDLCLLNSTVYLNLQVIPMNGGRKPLFIFIQRLKAKIKYES